MFPHAIHAALDAVDGEGDSEGITDPAFAHPEATRTKATITFHGAPLNRFINRLLRANIETDRAIPLAR